MLRGSGSILNYTTSPQPPLQASLLVRNHDLHHYHDHHHGSNSGLISSITTSVAIVSLAFILTASIHILLRRCRSSTVDTSMFDSSSEESVHDTSSRAVPEVGNQTLINSLPLSLFKWISVKTSTADCAVCLNKFGDNDQLRLLPACAHAFHSTCIDTWLALHDTCPLCRSIVQLEESALKDLPSSPGGSFRVEIGTDTELCS